MTDAITEGLSFTVTPDLFGETRINLHGLNVEQVDALFGAVNAALVRADAKQTLEPVVGALYDALKDLANDPKAAP